MGPLKQSLVENISLQRCNCSIFGLTDTVALCAKEAGFFQIMGVLPGTFAPLRSRWPPIFFFISDITNSSSFSAKICRKKSMLENFRANVLKAAKYEIQKPSTCRATLFPCNYVLVDVSRFSPCVINLTRNKNICCALKKCRALIGWFASTRAHLLRDKLWAWWKSSNKAKISCSE